MPGCQLQVNNIEVESHMTFQEAVKDAFSKYTQFSGRSSRSAYWYWYLFLILGEIVAGITDAILGTGSIVLIIFALGVIIPGLAVSVRRLHDIGRSGWWLLISLLPIIGFIVLIVFYVTKSDGPNEYGQGPDVPAAA
jgi:uncharacterized membrane protein YhaH (DUF805 family)